VATTHTVVKVVHLYMDRLYVRDVAIVSCCIKLQQDVFSLVQ